MEFQIKPIFHVKSYIIKILFFGLSFFFITCLNGQEQDSLVLKDYEFLKNKIIDLENDSTLINVYAMAFLKKAKIESNEFKILDGYYYLSLYNDFETSLAYTDSIIEGSLNKDYLDYPVLGYMQKGDLYYEKNDFKNAIENFANGADYIDKKTDSELYFITRNNIAIIKKLIGENEDALELYKDNYKFANANKTIKEDLDYYLTSISSLAISFRENGKLDSAATYTSLGINIALNNNKIDYYAPFLVIEGINLYNMQNYAKSNDSLTKSIPLLIEINDSLNLAYAYLYKGKILNKKKYFSKAVDYFKQVDSIITVKEHISPDFAETYELLNNYFKKTDNINQQLFYLEKRIAYNDQLRLNLKGVQKTISNKFDQPQLLLEKESLIQILKSKNIIFSKGLYLLFALLGLSVILTFYYARKRVLYKKRYEKLLNDDISNDKIVKKTSTILSKKLVKELVSKIELFEIEKEFLDNSISLSKMSKMLNTNSNYLSKIINHLKNQNFSSYINELRVQYAIQKLKEDTQFRKYDIKSIAHEVGFNSAESFSKAFYKQTGIYPSYFIKQLNKKEA